MIRPLLLRAIFHAAMACGCLAALLFAVIAAISAELSDEVRASRNETKRNGGTMHRLPKNRRVHDFPSTAALRLMNAQLAAVHADNSRVEEHVDIARFYAGNAAMVPVRRSL